MSRFPHRPEVQVGYGLASWEVHCLHFDEVIFYQIILSGSGKDYTLHDD